MQRQMTLLTLVLFADYARKFESAHLKKVGDLKPRDVIEEEDTVGQMHSGTRVRHGQLVADPRLL